MTKKYKGRLIVKGFSQRKCIDFDKIFSLVVKMGFIRVVLGCRANDFKTTFLHGDMDKKIHMEQLNVFLSRVS